MRRRNQSIKPVNETSQWTQMKPVNEAGHAIGDLRYNELNLSCGVSFVFQCEHFNAPRTVTTCRQSMNPINAKPKPVNETGQNQMKRVTETDQPEMRLQGALVSWSRTPVRVQTLPIWSQISIWTVYGSNAVLLYWARPQPPLYHH